jgi:hypothetical protein
VQYRPLTKESEEPRASVVHRAGSIPFGVTFHQAVDAPQVFSNVLRLAI